MSSEVENNIGLIICSELFEDCDDEIKSSSSELELELIKIGVTIDDVVVAVVVVVVVVVENGRTMAMGID